MSLTRNKEYHRLTVHYIVINTLLWSFRRCETFQDNATPATKDDSPITKILITMCKFVRHTKITINHLIPIYTSQHSIKENKKVKY